MAKAKKVLNETVYVPPPDNRYWFYVGDNYYKRIQPIPYAYKLNLKQLQQLKQLK